MIDNRDGQGAALEAGDRTLLAEDFEQLERALSDLLATQHEPDDEPVATPARPAAIFAEAWLVCGLDARAACLDADWEQAFTAAEREDLAFELPGAGAAPQIRPRRRPARNYCRRSASCTPKRPVRSWC